jgi:hypothetical protein
MPRPGRRSQHNQHEAEGPDRHGLARSALSDFWRSSLARFQPLRQERSMDARETQSLRARRRLHRIRQRLPS